MSLFIHKNILIHSRSIMVPRREVGSSDRGSTGSGPLIKRRIDAGSDRAEAAGSSGGAGSYAQGGGGACRRLPLDPDLPGDRQARSLHADRDEDSQGIRGARRGVGEGGVACSTIPTVAPISSFFGATLCANFAFIGFSGVRFTLGRERAATPYNA